MVIQDKLVIQVTDTLLAYNTYHKKGANALLKELKKKNKNTYSVYHSKAQHLASSCILCSVKSRETRTTN